MGRATLKLIIENSARSGLDSFSKHLLLKFGLQHNTINNYMKMVRKFLNQVGDQKLSKELVEDYIADMYIEDKYSYHHITATIRSLEKYMGFLGHEIKMGRPRKPKYIQKDTLSEAQIAVILSSTKKIREKSILSVLAYTGIRNEELCNLLVRDINFSDNTVFISQGKNSQDRVVPIAGECMKLVNKYLQEFPRSETSFLFTTLRGNEQYTEWALRRLVKKIVSKTEIKKRISPHTFRRAYASNMHDRGADIKTIQYLMGHSNIATTELYIMTNSRMIRANYLRFTPSYL